MVGTNASGNKKSITHRVQFGDVNFIKFLASIGIGPTKSKTINKISVPDPYFFDFLRGCFDGDGSIHSYWDSRWKSSFMFYTSFASASRNYIDWIRSQIFLRRQVKGHVTKARTGSTFQLKYAKRDSCIVIQKMYYSKNLTYLNRKKLKIDKILAIVGKSL